MTAERIAHSLPVSLISPLGTINRIFDALGIQLGCRPKGSFDAGVNDCDVRMAAGSAHTAFTAASEVCQ
jgi:hypothetical protein